jgi:hypothetical protein
MRKLPQLAAVAVLVLAGTLALAQAGDAAHDGSAPAALRDDGYSLPSIGGPSSTPLLPPNVVLPRMAPELALQRVQKHGLWQSAELVAYSDEVEIDAQLPESSQQGNFQLLRQYSAPNGLRFTPVRFTGDGFVKQNVITRLLQSEVEHVERGDESRTALSEQNYKFSYKGREQLDGREVHVFQVKPRRKEPGLFKGRIYVDTLTGSLRRAEGTLAKSPSFFIKSVDFVQDYDDVAGFTFPVRMHSTAVTRIVGRAVVDIFHRNYHPQSLAQIEPQGQAVPVVAAGSPLN